MRKLGKYTFVTIIVLASVSLLGIVFMQTFWISKSWKIAQNQFNHRVDNTLNDVVRELKNYADDNFREKHNLPELSHNSPTTIFNKLDTTVLDMLMKKYVNYHMLKGNFIYAIVKTGNDSVIYASKNFDNIKPKNEPHRACLSGLWKEEYHNLILWFPSRNRSMLVELSFWLVLSFIFILIAILSFIYVLFMILKQKKLSEMKSDFINNMTHEFKTPISTISLAAEVLLNSNGNTSNERIKRYSKIIFDENSRMSNQVERVLNMALQERGELKLNISLTDIHSLIKKTVSNYLLNPKEKKIKIKLNLDAEDSSVFADDMHITNVINNIIDNAFKYSNGNSELIISSSGINNGILLSFKDNGIGMTTETQKHIFEKFYRQHTGNIHNVKGFGLGLHYVRTMVEAHGGNIMVQSELNKGSCFNVYLPKRSTLINNSIDGKIKRENTVD